MRVRVRGAQRSWASRGVAALALTGAAAWVAAAVAGAQGPPPRAEARTFAGRTSETAIVAALLHAEPDRFRPIGTTSLTFQVDLAGSIDAAFKPESRFHPRGWLAEVAAYRVARELGLDSVPPAVVRPVDRSLLRRRVELADGVSWDDLESGLVAGGSGVRGAFIYWVPGLLRSDLDTPAGIARWTGWLAQPREGTEDGDIPAEHAAIARDLSNALIFDYLIGNRDRWSGGNVRPIEGGRLVIRDHNLAFPHALGEGVQRRMLETLMRGRRFSRRTIERLAGLDEETLRSAIADHDPVSLLDDRQIADVMERREAILTYVGALIEAYGAESVLFFP